MGAPEVTFKDRLSHLTFTVYLWTIGMTKDEFWKQQESDAFHAITDEDALVGKYSCRCPACGMNGRVSQFLRKK